MAAASGTGSISGTVRNTGGTALPDVDVVVFDKDGEYLNDTVTDSGGAYSLTGLDNVPVYVRTFNMLGYIDEWYDNVIAAGNWNAADATALDLGANPTRININFSLATGKTISGKVTNASSTGLADVEVDAYDLDGNWIWDAFTDSSGNYSITGLPAGQYHVATLNDLGYIDEWYNNIPYPGNWEATGATIVNVTSTNASSINFLLATGKTISGKVANTSSTGLADVEVDAYDLDGNSIRYGLTDSSGNFSISGLRAGQYHIRTFASQQGYADEWWNNIPIATDPYGDTAGTIDLRTASSSTGKNFVLAAGHTIGGTVTASSGGAPLANEWVLVDLPDTGYGEWAQTDETGAWSVDGLYPAQYRVHTENLNGYVDEWYNNVPVVGHLDGAGANLVNLTSADNTSVNFALDNGYSISGTVLDGGSPVTDFMSIDIYNGGGTLMAPGWVNNGDLADGTYSTPALPAGTYYARSDRYYGGESPLTYADEWYHNLPCAQYDLASATPIAITSADRTGIDFDLAPMNYYEQADPHITYSTGWSTYPTPPATGPASGGSYARGTGSGSSATIYFNGVSLDWIAMMGTTTGKADIFVDDVPLGTVDLSAPAPTYQVMRFSTGDLPRGTHKVKFVWNTTNLSGKFITLDALRVDGTLVYAPPTVTGLNPNTGSTLGGDSVIITGANLTGATTVTFGGVNAASFNVDSATQITAVTPVHGAGTVQVQVTTAAGSTANTAADDFTFAIPGVPTITSLSPNTGSIDGGTSVTINGTNFTGLSGLSAVTFGGVNAASYTVNSNVKITAVAPAHAEGTISVQVTAAGGTTADTANDDFTYTTTPPVTRYDQFNNTNIVKTGAWADYTSPGSYDGKYGRSSTGSASATIWFSGTQIDYIAMKGTTTGYADIYLDGVKKATVNLAATSPKYQQDVWSSGPLSSRLHSFKIVRSTASATGKYLTLDAVDIAGTIAAPPILYQQGNTHIVKTGVWNDFSSASASGGSYGRSLTTDASATITFNGTGLAVITTKGTTTGIVDIYLDGALTPTATIDLTATSVTYQMVIWSTGILSNDVHTVRLVRNSGSASTKYLTLDAVDVFGGTIQ